MLGQLTDVFFKKHLRSDIVFELLVHTNRNLIKNEPHFSLSSHTNVATSKCLRDTLLLFNYVPVTLN